MSARRVVNVPKRASATRRWPPGRLGHHPLDQLRQDLRGAAHAGLTGKALRAPRSWPASWPSCGSWSTSSPRRLRPDGGERTGYLAELLSEHTHEADSRIENVAELVGVANEYEELTEFLETVPWWPTPTRSTTTAPRCR